MFKFVVLYYRVDDQNALEDFFSYTHLPLTEKLPGLIKTEVGRITGKPGGNSRFHLEYSAYFADENGFLQAMTSEPGRELMAALMTWADARLISWYYAESFSESRPD